VCILPQSPGKISITLHANALATTPRTTSSVTVRPLSCDNGTTVAACDLIGVVHRIFNPRTRKSRHNPFMPTAELYGALTTQARQTVVEMERVCRFG
jgi:hypothetical protein